MTENKRFELQVDVQGKADIIDWVESKEKNAICIYNDLGVLPFSSAKAVCDKLNEQDERIKELETENNQLKRKKERYKLLSEIRDENINNRILSLKDFINNCEDEKVKNILEDLFYSEVKEYDLAKENRKLKRENEQLKKENENLNNVLEDFMTITNRLQSEPHNKSLPLMARDMLRLMGKNVMGDSE